MPIEPKIVEPRTIVTGDICARCGKDFGLSGDDPDGGYNSRCVHCGSNIYTPEEVISNAD